MTKKNPLIKIISKSALTLPCPTNISYMWNMGSLLGTILAVQLLTGVFLAMYYVSSSTLAFESVADLMRNTNYGWLIRIIHANGASMFFCLLYLHTARGMYYMSYLMMKETWLSGVSILLLTMATAFLGYVLPWGQMSFWGATVITNLFSAIPYVGDNIVIWLWGGHAVGAPTLTRFFALHYLLPFIISGLVMVHLLFLHQTGSNNPLGVQSNYSKLVFHPYYSTKDMLGVFIMLSLLMSLVMLNSWLLGDSENFIPANSLVTPVHIQPEWYFLFAYAILRSIPNKLGGVIALALSVLILYVLPFIPSAIKINHSLSSSFNTSMKILFWSFVVVVSLLTWIGACPVEPPYVLVGQILTLLYFLYFILIMGIFKMNFVMKY